MKPSVCFDYEVQAIKLAAPSFAHMKSELAASVNRAPEWKHSGFLMHRDPAPGSGREHGGSCRGHLPAVIRNDLICVCGTVA